MGVVCFGGLRARAVWKIPGRGGTAATDTMAESAGTSRTCKRLTATQKLVTRGVFKASRASTEGPGKELHIEQVRVAQVSNPLANSARTP